MTSRLNQLLDLLHRCEHGALATHSVTMPGFPFVTGLPFIADVEHCPVFLLSRLAEHTRNLLQDGRASLLLRAVGDGPEVARATLVGEVQPTTADQHLIARYLRYQPAAEQFLALGDFGFFRLLPQRVRFIGGFAQAGWIESKRLVAAPTMAAAVEADLIARFAPTLPAGITLLGVDPFGVDLRLDGTAGGRRDRVSFSPGPVVDEAAGPALARALARLVPG